MSNKRVFIITTKFHETDKSFLGDSSKLSGVEEIIPICWAYLKKDCIKKPFREYLEKNKEDITPDDRDDVISFLREDNIEEWSSFDNAYKFLSEMLPESLELAWKEGKIPQIYINKQDNDIIIAIQCPSRYILDFNIWLSSLYQVAKCQIDRGLNQEQDEIIFILHRGDFHRDVFLECKALSASGPDYILPDTEFDNLLKKDNRPSVAEIQNFENKKIVLFSHIPNVSRIYNCLRGKPENRQNLGDYIMQAIEETKKLLKDIDEIPLNENKGVSDIRELKKKLYPDK